MSMVRQSSRAYAPERMTYSPCALLSNAHAPSAKKTSYTPHPRARCPTGESIARENSLRVGVDGQDVDQVLTCRCGWAGR